MTETGVISLTDSYWGLQLLTAAVAIALFALLRPRLLRSTQGSVLTGIDGRWSTSRFAALLWTSVAVYMLISLVIIGLREGAESQELSGKFDEMNGIYLALLGGPFAAFLLAKVAVQGKMSGDNPSLQKTTGTQPRPSDLVTDDSGNTDIVDFQYVLFNLVAAAYVLALYLPHPGLGIPAVPTTLAILTGGSAVTYVTNKAVASNAPNISAMVPSTLTHASVVAGGQSVKLYGSYLQTPDGQGSTVTVGGKEAPVVGSSMDHLTFTVPTDIAADAGGYLVEVVTAAGLKASSPEKLSITP